MSSKKHKALIFHKKNKTSAKFGGLAKVLAVSKREGLVV